MTEQSAPPAPQSPALLVPGAQLLGPAEWAMLLVLSLLWGGSFLFIKIAVNEVPPLTLVLFRVSLAALALHLVLRLWPPAPAADGISWRDYVMMGLLNNLIPFSLISAGQTQIGAGLASILNATTPLFTVLVAHVFTSDDRLTARKLAGVLFGLGGVVVLMAPQLATGGLSGTLMGQLALLGATLSYGLSGLYGRRFRHNPPLRTAAGQLAASSIMILPAVLLVDQPWSLPLPSPRAIMAILALALVSTAVAYLLFFRIMARAGATNVSLVTLLIPPNAIALGILVLGERLAPSHILGCIIIVLSLSIIDGRLWGRLAARMRS